MYYPSLDKIRELRDREMSIQADKRRPILPVYHDILVDLETPVSAYCKVARGAYSFLLESVASGERIGRYSFIGVDPYMILTHRDEKATLHKLHDTSSNPEHDLIPPYSHTLTPTIEEVPCHDPITLIQSELERYRLVVPADIPHDELPSFHGGAVGYLAYEYVGRFENLPIPEKDILGLPMAILCFTENVLVFDHLKHRIRIVTHLHLDASDLDAEYHRSLSIINDVQQRLHQPMRLPEEPAPIHDADALKLVSNRTRSEFEDMVKRAKEYIRAGDIFQVVPSQRLSRCVNASAFTVYRALRALNPSPYMFYLDLEDFHIIGASPELMVRVEDGEVSIHPIAGTRPRGTDKQSDQQLAEEMKNDPKERAEHIMLLDLGRNDVGRVSVPGSVRVSQFIGIERYSHVMHLVSNVVGRLREDVTPYDAFRAGFPAGTVSGAPKIRAMEIISELEGEQRGVYAGAVGYFSYSGNLDTALALRTMVIQNGRAYIQAGAGIVADSDPGFEYQESMNKAKALLRALDEAEIIANNRRNDMPTSTGGFYAVTN